MATTPVIIPAPVPEPSIAELRAELWGPPAIPVTVEKPAKAEAAEATTETPETTETEKPEGRKRDEHGKFVAAEGKTETESGTVQTQEPDQTVEDKEEPLPANVQKRIAKEVEKQARIDREIAEHVSRTKSRQAELEKLKADTGTSGSEPVKTTEPAKVEGKPVRPVKPKPFGESGFTWEQQAAADAKFEEDLNAHEEALMEWALGEGERRTARILAEKDAKAKADQLWGSRDKDISEARQRLLANSSEELQLAISALDDDATVSMVAHLGKLENADELARLDALVATNPYAAAIAIGKLDDRLNKPATQEPTTVTKPQEKKPLPEPPARVGGGATAAAKVDLEKADMKTFKREIQGHLGR